MRWLWLAILPGTAQADSLIATRLIAAGSLIAAQDVTLAQAAIPGALGHPAQAVGQTARTTIYPGRPLLAANLGPPVTVARNQSVTLRYSAGSLSIAAEGRALGQGGPGDLIRVLNTASKITLTGRIQPDGTIDIGGSPCAGC